MDFFKPGPSTFGLLRHNFLLNRMLHSGFDLSSTPRLFYITPGRRQNKDDLAWHETFEPLTLLYQVIMFIVEVVYMYASR